MSLELRQRRDAGDIDIAVIKREPDSGPAWATWPERLVWVKGVDFDSSSGVLQLTLFPQGCLYRQRAIRELNVAQRPWRLALISREGVLNGLKHGLVEFLRGELGVDANGQV
jgi:hypothetical protein